MIKEDKKGEKNQISLNKLFNQLVHCNIQIVGCQQWGGCAYVRTGVYIGTLYFLINFAVNLL